jgi:hypothetical protein
MSKKFPFRINHYAAKTIDATHHSNLEAIVTCIVLLVILVGGIVWGVNIGSLPLIVFFSLGAFGISISLVFDLYFLFTTLLRNRTEEE